jgi:hypothetical protein
MKIRAVTFNTHVFLACRIGQILLGMDINKKHSVAEYLIYVGFKADMRKARISI